MRKEYVKFPIPEEISEDGGATARFVNKFTVALDGAIDDAIAGNYCIGNKTLVRNLFMGLMQCIADNIMKDGRPRQIGSYITIYPVPTGDIDLEKGWDREVNGIKVRARLRKEMSLDASDWSFVDVTPGKRGFTLNSIKAGEVIGVYDVAEKGEINGKNLPSTESGEPLEVHWEVPGTDKSGDFTTAQLTSNVSRIDVAAGALSVLQSAEYDGKVIDFTVRGNYSSAKISATLKYTPPADPTLTTVKGDESGTNVIKSNGEGVTFTGENLAGVTKLRAEWIGIDGLEDGQDYEAADFASHSDTEIKLSELGLYERLAVGSTGTFKAYTATGESNTLEFVRAED